MLLANVSILDNMNVSIINMNISILIIEGIRGPCSLVMILVVNHFGGLWVTQS